MCSLDSNDKVLQFYRIKETAQIIFGIENSSIIMSSISFIL